jgi:hypothetical protein
VNGRGLQSTVHIPPRGKGPGGELNVDYCETEEQVTQTNKSQKARMRNLTLLFFRVEP